MSAALGNTGKPSPRPSLVALRLHHASTASAFLAWLAFCRARCSRRAAAFWLRIAFSWLIRDTCAARASGGGGGGGRGARRGKAGQAMRAYAPPRPTPPHPANSLAYLVLYLHIERSSRPAQYPHRRLAPSEAVRGKAGKRGRQGFSGW